MEFLSEIIHRDRFLIENGFHTRNAIIIVLEGEFTCSIYGRSAIVSPNDICIFPKEIPFERRVLQPLKCVYIQFETFPQPLAPGLLKPADPVRQENTITHLTQAVAEENGELSEHFLRDILILQKYQGGQSVRDQVVSACIAYFNQNYPEHISLDLLAGRFSVSKQGLIQKFRRHTNKTPMEYLAAVRITQSKRLLKNTDLSVGEIAGQCGFENVYYFSNFFKKAAGVSPSDYRKMVGNL